MAQGGLKKKQFSKFVLPSKSKRSKDASKPPKAKKRGGYIAPKKASLVKANKLKKGLEKAIGQKIEQEVIQLASNSGENLRLVAGGLGKSQKRKSKS